MSADRNLLAGILALQMDFVSGEQLLAGMRAWTEDKKRPLLDVLRERGALDAADVDAVDRLVARHLARHGGDAAKSLAAVRLDPEVGRSLAAVADEGVREGLSTVNSLPPTPTPPVSEGGSALGPAGGPTRYRRLRGHAKGGLGEVSVALDEELRREVALKEIQPQFADYPEMRARFVREAEITGQLEHPGVVPIYGLGVGPDGRPYYAMRFIAGESLEAAIRRHHQGGDGSGLRALLTRFVAVCYAVGFAHSRGVIHRDLKPANVMLGEYGETLVVDWGLARHVSEKEEETRIGRPLALSTEGGTVEGHAVGTPPYMPPEQARGRLDEVGPHSDVWALGAVLYAILTGRPPYQGPTALIDAAACEPRPRMAKAPAGLEAVCRKAMAKEPAARYPKAKELAAEVERWLADEPVGAYRDPLSVRATRWARKHRTLVASLGVLLVAGLVALGVVLAAVRFEQGKTQAALGEAKANLKLARRVVDEYFELAKDDPLFQGGGMLPAKKRLLAQGLPFYRDFQERGGGEVEVDAAAAEKAFRVGYITAQLGQHDEALRAFRRAEQIRQRLADAHPAVPDYQHNLARTLHNTGALLAGLGKRDEALEAYRRAEQIEQRLADAHPAVP
ncbi:MAG: serine/threonine-protein kinase, partial [Gemmataceae bacterium]